MALEAEGGPVGEFDALQAAVKQRPVRGLHIVRQGRSIEPGVFTKVRIYFLNNDAGDALQCDGVASATRPGVPITIDLPEDITVAAGESVTVTLNYDPSAVDCADEMTISSAISAMTATVTKN
jgi:hypothetical protein